MSGCSQGPSEAPPASPPPRTSPPARTQPQTLSTEPIPPEVGKVGGTFTLASISDPKSLNPIVAKETSTTAVTAYIFEGLTRTNAFSTEVEPWLATSWDISEDGMRWVFHLRQDVQWSDGEPFTAQDVEFTFNDLIYNPEIPATARDNLTVEGKPFQVRALDEHTVEFILPTRFAPFLRALGQGILPAHRLAASVEAGTFASTWGLGTPPEEIVGTGPFKLAEYLPAQHVRLVRNPTYWRKDEAGQAYPYLEEVRILIVQSADVGLLKFKDGELDTYGLRSSDYKILKPGEREGNYTVYELGPQFGTSFITFNQNPGANPETQKPFIPRYKHAWFTDLTFRTAVAHAIDKQSIIDIVMDGLGYPQHAAMSPTGGFFYNGDVAKYAFDIERAKALLAEGGYIDRDGDGVIEDAQGHPVEFNLFTNSGNTDRVQIANLMRKDLERIGMRVHFTQLEFNNLVMKLDSTFNWDAIIIGLTGGIEPHFGKTVWYSDGHLHMWYPKQASPATAWEAELDTIFDQGVQELDRQKRKALYDRWQVIVAEQLPLIYTVLAPRLTAVRNRFGNVHPASFGGVLHNVEELFVTDSRP